MTSRPARPLTIVLSAFCLFAGATTHEACSSFGDEDGVDGGTSPAPEAGVDTTVLPDSATIDAPSGVDAGDAADGSNPSLACGEGKCRLVFVTSGTMPGSFGSVAEADRRCQTAASASKKGYVGGRFFKAWLSDGPANSVIVRFTKDSRPFRRVDGVLVAQDWTDLTKPAGIRVPINIDENGISVPAGYAWTATATSGAAESLACLGWSADAGTTMGQVGNTYDTGPQWTNGGTAQAQMCNSPLRLYCFEQ